MSVNNQKTRAGLQASQFDAAYLLKELLYRWGRSLFVIGGVGLAVSIVILLPVLGQGFQSLASCLSKTWMQIWWFSKAKQSLPCREQWV